MTPTDLHYLHSVTIDARREAATNPKYGDAEFLEVLEATQDLGWKANFRASHPPTDEEHRMVAAVVAWVCAIEAEKEQT